MKRVLSLGLLFSMLVIAPFGSQSISHAQISPWPWAISAPFAWNDIQGTWSEETSEYLFSFQVIKNSWGEKIIKIFQIDPTTNQVIARGLGSENSSSVVVAAMSGGPLGQYRFTVRYLQDSSGWLVKPFVGVTIESLNNDLITYFEINKINDLPLTRTKRKLYKGHRCKEKR